jgi:hypothetical protein
MRCGRTVAPFEELSPHSLRDTPMFLVEIEAGREALYDSVNALAAAIRRGEVGPHSRIFHRTSSSWLSITIHPEFKKAVAARDSQPLPPLARSQWTFFGTEPRGREIDEPPVTNRDREAGEIAAKPSESRGRLRGLLSRAFRSRASAPGTPDTSGA